MHETEINLMLFSFWFILDGYENARRLCDLYYINSPELELEELNGKPDVVFSSMISVMITWEGMIE